MTAIDDPMRELALSYAPPDRRAAVRALFALDATLGQVLRTTREPMVGQMRLAWWREALVRLDTAPAPGEPVLQALAADALPHGASGKALAKMIDGWEPLLGTIDDAAIFDHGAFRGSALFEMAGRVLGTSPDDPVALAGYAWALADLADNLSEPEAAATARDEAIHGLTTATSARWSRNGRALGALALRARFDLTGTPTTWRVPRLAWHRLTGR